MFLKVKRLSEGPGPKEVVVEVATIDGGVEEMIVDQRALRDDSVEVGHPISAHNGHSLVELPREAMSGRWRVWVENSEIATQ